MLNKGQGSLEYLLIVGGAIAVAAIVIYLVLTSTGKSNTTIGETERRAQIAQECGVTCVATDCDPPYATRTQCEAGCKTQGYGDSAINSNDCLWDCDATPTAGDWMQRVNPSLPC